MDACDRHATASEEGVRPFVRGPVLEAGTQLSRRIDANNGRQRTDKDRRS